MFFPGFRGFLIVLPRLFEAVGVGVAKSKTTSYSTLPPNSRSTSPSPALRCYKVRSPSFLARSSCCILEKCFNLRGLDGEDGGGNSTSLDGKNVPVASGKTTYEAVSSEEREESADASGKAFLIRCCLIWVECPEAVNRCETRAGDI